MTQPQVARWRADADRLSSNWLPIGRPRLHDPRPAASLEEDATVNR